MTTKHQHQHQLQCREIMQYAWVDEEGYPMSPIFESREEADAWREKQNSVIIEEVVHVLCAS